MLSSPIPPLPSSPQSTQSSQNSRPLSVSSRSNQHHHFHSNTQNRHNNNIQQTTTASLNNQRQQHHTEHHTADLSASAITPGPIRIEMSPSAPPIGTTPIEMIVLATESSSSPSSPSSLPSSTSSSITSSLSSPTKTTASMMSTTTMNVLNHNSFSNNSNNNNNNNDRSHQNDKSMISNPNSISSRSSSSSISTTTSSSSSVTISKASICSTTTAATVTKMKTTTTSSLLSSSSSSSSSSSASITSEMIMKECVCCFGCQQPIRDRYLMCVSERYWHETCLQCTVCRISLTSSCYVKEKKIYCKSDYNKLYATKCSICLGSIDSNELVMRVHSYVYHLPCFNCIWCRRQLRKGDKFALRGRQPICEIDLAKENIEISPSSLTLHSFDTDSLIPSLIPNRHHIHHLNHLNLSEHHHLRSQPDLAIYEMSNGFGCGGGHSPTSSPSIIDGSLQSIGSMIPNHGPLTNKQNLCLDPLVDSCGRQQHPFSSRALTICDSTTVLSPAAIKNDPSLSYPPSTPSPTMQQQPPPSIPPQSQSSSASSISHAMNNGNSMQNNPHHNHHGNTNNNSSTNTSIPIKQDGRRGPKRPRTILTTAQRRAFKASFEISQKPCRKVRETLAKETGLSVRIVQVWFQNQRAKLKKIQRKQQQQQLSQSGGGLMLGNGSESGGGLGSSDKSKGDSTDEDDDVDEDDDDDDSQRFSLPYMLQSPDGGSYYSGRGEEDGYTVKSELGGLDDSETSLCEMDDGIIHRPTSASDPIRLSSNSSSSGTSVVNQNNNNSNSMPFGLMMISNNGPISSSLSQQQHAQQLPPASSHHHPTSTAFSTNDSHHIPHHPSLPIHHNPHLNPFQHHQNHSSLPTSNQIHSLPNMTPIDKLYSMQNSYFNNPSECEC